MNKYVLFALCVANLSLYGMDSNKTNTNEKKLVLPLKKPMPKKPTLKIRGNDKPYLKATGSGKNTGLNGATGQYNNVPPVQFGDN